jgi:hypothetical protein
MWNGLNNEVKLLLSALLVIAFVVVTETSQNLAQLVRRLYSGTWPVVSGWQQILRHKHLRKRLRRNLQAFDLDRARVVFQEVRDLIGVHLGPGETGDPAAAVSMEEYPVLRSALTPFRPIAMGDLDWVRLPKKSGAITSVVDLVGRYAVAPITARQPIPAEKLRTPPDPRFLAEGRAVVWVSVSGGQAAAYLQAGVVAVLHTRDGYRSQDLLVLDRAADTQLAIAVSESDLACVVAAVKDGSGTFIVEPHTSAANFSVVPVARQRLRAGQLVARDDVVWEARGMQTASLTEANILGKAWWRTAGEHRESACLQGGEILRAGDLMDVPNTVSLLDGRAPRGVRFCPHYGCVQRGDIVSFRYQASTLADGCFVFDVANGMCYAAIPTSTSLPDECLDVLVDGTIPVVARWLEPGQLVGGTLLTSMERRRLAALPPGSCVLPAQIRHHYVEGPAGLEPNQPIPGQYLVPAFPPDAPGLDLWEEHPLARQIRCVGAWPVYGDLVTIRLARCGLKVWEDQRLFVLRAQPGARLVVKIPAQPDGIDPQTEWDKMDMVATVSTTHSDQLAEDALAKLRRSVEYESALPNYNAAMSDREPSTEEFCTHAPKLAGIARQIREQKARLLERPWSSGSGASAAQMLVEYKRLLRLLDGVAAMWLDLIKRMRDNIERAALVDLPRDPSDVRPTALGNVLAASAAYPWRAYGIDTVTLLPMLLTVLTGDEAAVKRFRAADASLDLLLLSSFWATVWSVLCFLTGALVFEGVLVSGAGRWVFPALALAGLCFAWLMREAALAQAYGYGDAGKVLFDLHRQRLLSSLGLVVPDELTAKEESEQYWQPLYHWFAFGTHDESLRLKLGNAPSPADASTSPSSGSGAQPETAAGASLSKNGVG